MMPAKKCRKRLRPWLERKCNDKEYPDHLSWFDEGRKMFRISWKHQNNRNWDTSDAMVYKGWALYTGKYKEGDPEHLSDMKTRLRTALTKLNDIEEMKDYHNLDHPTKPYKVYRFLDDNVEECVNGNVEGSPSSESGYSGYSESLSPSSQPSPASQASPASQYLQELPQSQIDFLEISDVEMDVSKSHLPEGLQECMPYNIPTVVLEEQVHFPSADHSGAGSVNVSEPTNNFDILPSDSGNPSRESNLAASNIKPNLQQNCFKEINFSEQSIIPADLEGIDSGDLVNINLNATETMSIGSSLPSLESQPPMNPIAHPTILQVKMFFVDQLVYETLIEEHVRLFCGNLEEQAQVIQAIGQDTVFGPMNIKQIRLPEIDEIAVSCTVNEKQKALIRNIQENMCRGLLVGAHNSNIYAQRLCKARVFVFTQDGQNVRMDRNNKNASHCVFDMEKFKKQLEDHRNHRGPQPRTSVIFTFGQEYKDNFLDLRRVLLYVKVTHDEAFKMLNQVVDATQSDYEAFVSESVSGDLLLAQALEAKLVL